jgi:uncharacterized membrane protein
MPRLQQWWMDVRGSLWFVPGQIVLGAVAAAIGLVQLDLLIAPDVLQEWPLLFGAGADGSRALLSAVATSMITVAGVAFSITVVALSLTASQYTSRVLRNFMSDRTNQTVLGMFVGIFAYCLVVLRTIRGGDEGKFVPSLAVLFGLALAFIGIGVLIYFIHHIATSIQAAHLLATAADETRRAVDRVFPAAVRDPDREERGLTEATGAGWQRIPAGRTGYLRWVDLAALEQYAREHDTVVRLDRAVGDFVIEGMPLVSLKGAPSAAATAVDVLKGSCTIGRQRSINQDVAFGIRQIVDVALKALSPGINDTTTAVMCLDHLTAILVQLSSRRIVWPPPGEDGPRRVLATGPTFAGLLRDALHQIRESAAGNSVIIERLLRTLSVLARHNLAGSRRRVLLDHARATAELARRTIPAPADRRRLERLATRLRRRLAHPGGPSVTPAAGTTLSATAAHPETV